MKYIFCLLFTLINFSALASTDTNTLLEELKNEIAKKNIYNGSKEVRIQKLKAFQAKLSKTDYDARFDTWDKLYTEYKSYQFDSAYVYVDKMILLSKETGNKRKEYYSYVKMAFILLSSGMFNETFDYLHKVDVKALSDADKVEYYFFLGRCNYDLANYSNDKYFSPDYVKAGNKYIDSAVVFCGNDHIMHTYLLGLQDYQKKDYKGGRLRFRKLLEKDMPITMHLRAMVSCSLGAICLEDNEHEEGLNLMIRAAIADIKSSTRETVALYTLAELLYKQGNIKDAYSFIQLAKADADFYGARQRKIQIAAILPLIAAA
ncbi:DUF6377 domain-containing protein, partial [Mucilaginibacter sp.]|uniref:DUF6377 domain-containing protein n=1 Tax=Mucilaginibacter sp. TaxID=1882438 RepID=UPI002ED51E03